MPLRSAKFLVEPCNARGRSPNKWTSGMLSRWLQLVVDLPYPINNDRRWRQPTWQARWLLRPRWPSSRRAHCGLTLSEAVQGGLGCGDG